MMSEMAAGDDGQTTSGHSPASRGERAQTNRSERAPSERGERAQTGSEHARGSERIPLRHLTEPSVPLRADLDEVIEPDDTPSSHSVANPRQRMQAIRREDFDAFEPSESVEPQRSNLHVVIIGSVLLLAVFATMGLLAFR
jgi:hypothetical protein